MIYPCGRKDAVGKPILYATTDNFLKRFKLNSIDELPDYDDLMAQIAELNNAYLSDEDDSNYLYKKDEYVEEADSNVDGDAENAVGAKEKNNVQAEPASPKNADDMEVPDFLKDDDMVITIT
jgi:segregation and condensation protein B